MKSTIKVAIAAWVIAGFSATAALPAFAKVPAAKAAELDGPKFTCIGAERAGSASGIPAYGGKWVGTWPGQTKPFGYEPGPYKDEKPSFTITNENQAKYADKMTEGQKALMKKYPKSYRMNVYPSHRDFGFAPWACETAKKNAVTSEVLDAGLGVSGVSGAIPFPFPT